MPPRDPFDDLGLPRKYGDRATWVLTSPEFPGREVLIIRPEGFNESVFMDRPGYERRWVVAHDTLHVLAVAMDMLSK